MSALTSPADRPSQTRAQAAFLQIAVSAERLERLAASLCNLVEAHQRGDDDCVPAHLRNVTEDDVAMAVHELRGELASFRATAAGSVQ